MATTAAPAVAERSPLQADERQMLTTLHERHRVSVRNVGRHFPSVGGLASVGIVCALAAWQTGWVGHVLFGAGSLFFLWPIPKLVTAGPRFARQVAADLASGDVTVDQGPVVRRYYTRGRHGQAHLTLASGADAALPVELMHGIQEGDHVVLRRAAHSGCLLSIEHGGTRHLMPMQIHTGVAH
jgi:hypothetical protein